MRRKSVSRQNFKGQFEPNEKSVQYQSKAVGVGIDGILQKYKIAWMTQNPRSRYLRTGGILLFIVFILFYLSPGRSYSYKKVANIADGQKASDIPVGTTKCSSSFDKSKPLIQYVLMIDAGSTGSRIHVFKFNNCGPIPDLENEDFKMTEKKPGGSGLSSYKNDYEGAAKSLDTLMNFALSKVPDENKSCTPVAVKATAGLRLLGPEMSQKILDAVRTRLENVYPFPVVSEEENGIAIMDGKDEGVYAWITANFLLGKIGGPGRGETAAAFDLGGGSTQIVFEPTFKGDVPQKLAEGDQKYHLKFGDQDYELYQQSHLGYGLMSARESVHKTLIQEMYTANSSDPSWTSQAVVNPCIAPGMSRLIEVKLDPGHKLGEKISVNMTGPTSAAPAQCRGLAEKILLKKAPCSLSPCSFNGVYQPSLSATFAKGDIYTFSYFYDRINPLGMPVSFMLSELQRVTDQVCGGESDWDVFRGIPGALEELRGRPEHCLDLSYIMALLHTGYEIPFEREIKIAKKINHNELGWCLGASLPLLNPGSGWQCNKREVM
ncbi:putative guanosine-diphosphatase [Podosphaera aphanis]|nr:putative guanosine-diphosphatase [Podosphaera aphanis]